VHAPVLRQKVFRVGQRFANVVVHAGFSRL
jgi:hypothetical protein